MSRSIWFRLFLAILYGATIAIAAEKVNPIMVILLAVAAGFSVSLSPEKGEKFPLLDFVVVILAGFVVIFSGLHNTLLPIFPGMMTATLVIAAAYILLYATRGKRPAGAPPEDTY